MTPQGHEQQQAPPAPRGEFGHLDLSRIAQDLQIRKLQVEAVVQLLDEGNTIPFITRYRKERTGGLDEEVLRIIQERVNALRAMADRKQTILRTIEGQGKLTDELRAAILAADNPKRLEDLYLPYKPKKRSLAQAARDKGLERLAMAIWEADPVAANLDELLPTLINPEQGLNTTEEILQGAGHILAELIAESADVRAIVRAVLWDTGKLCTSKSEKLAEGQGQEFRDYFNFTEPIRQIPPHRILAINRGEKDNALTARLEWDAATGRRVAVERLPLPKKEEPKAEAPAPEGEAAAPPEAVAHHGPHQHGPHHGPRGHRGQPPPVNRTADLEKHPHRAFLEACIDDGMNRLLVPSLEREIRRELTQRSENHAVVVFARNLRSKLLAAPLRDRRVLAIDPAFRTGCKLAALNEHGDLLGDAVVYPHPPQNKRGEAKAKIEEMVRRHQIQVIAIGNGTACRETEELVSEVLADLEARRNNPTPPPAESPAPAEAPPAPPPAPEPVAEAAPPAETPAPTEAPAAPQAEVAAPPQPEAAPPPLPEAAAAEPPPLPTEPPPLPPEAAAPAPVAETPPPPPPEPLPEALPELAYVIVNEAGASVYSASSVGREEFPNFDATLRGTISIGRRLQDPLSELVKIDPQHVGVGLYQHDVSLKHLRESLDAVVESCVNTVGVDLNTASVPLLRHVSGLNALVAQRVVEWRKNNGPFRLREQLREVPGVGDRTFEQAAGFLKIQGDEPLDSTWIHPESYPVARQLLAELNCDPAVLQQRDRLAELREKLRALAPEEVAARMQVGVPTLRDILESLARPGRDPREDLPPPVFKKGILKLEDLQPGMELKGTVLNVVDFGAFIDIGLKDSGLVHISQMANRYVKSPYDVVSVGDVVGVWVLSVDSQRHRVSLTMIQPGTERRPPERRGPPPPREQREGGPPREAREGGPPREQREGGPPREQREGRGPRPPREGGRPPRGGQGRHGGPGGGPPQDGGKPRSTLPPRGTTRLGGGGRQQQHRKGPPHQQPHQQPAQAAEGGGQAQQPAEQAPPARKPRRSAPAPKLSQGALSGKEPLTSFSELAALMQTRLKEPAPAPTEAPAPPPEEKAQEQETPQSP
jgi:uncharacterized protein